MRIVPIDIPELGNRSYLVHDEHTAVVIDPSRRTQQIIDKAEAEHVTIRAVFETHVHNDYVTGGFTLARQAGAPYYISNADEVSFAHEPLKPEQPISVGTLTITAVATPGHTHNHIGYLITTENGPASFFSGGSLLYGAVGRTDLISEDATKPLAHAQYQTAQHLVARLTPNTKLYPTHGFGSFCAATQTEDVAVSTIAQQLRTNPVFASEEEAFVQRLLDGLDVHPAYYARMAPLNAAGPLEPDLTPPQQLTQAEVLKALHMGSAVVDMRARIAYASKHVPGTFNVESGNDLATYIGWLIRWKSPLILISSNSDEVSAAQEQLSLIGRGLIAGQTTPTHLLSGYSQVASYPARTFADLQEAAYDSLFILDVRRISEWNAAHVRNARHIPLHEIAQRIHELPRDEPIWVYCASGFRASIATSMLSTNGLHPSLINDNFSNAFRVGLVDTIKELYVAEIEHGNAQLIDVRDDTEWDTSHAREAVHVPVGKILAGDLDMLDANKTTYIYCETGERSGMAEHFLRDMGFDAVNIGGMDDWLRAGGVST